MKAMFTTGEAAEVCQVSQQTIIRCFDAGRLKGFKVPGSKFRRIPRNALIAFMKEHEIPLDALDSGKPKVLVVGADSSRLIETNGADAKYEMKAAATGYEAGILTQEFLPDVILMGVLDTVAEQVAICRTIRQNPDLKHIRIVVSAKAAGTETDQLMQAGATLVTDGSTDLDKIMQQVQL